jgi:hypothetical protein
VRYTFFIATQDELLLWAVHVATARRYIMALL